MNIAELIMPGICIICGLLMIFFFKKKEKDEKKEQLLNNEKEAVDSCQKFLNIKDIVNDRILTSDGYRIAIINIKGICVDLYNNKDKAQLINILSSELYKINFPFTFFSFERAFDIEKLKDKYNSQIQKADGVQRALLVMFLDNLNRMHSSGSFKERLFFVKLWEKVSDNTLNERITQICECFESSKIHCDLLNDKNLATLVNSINNPSVYSNDEIAKDLLNPTIPVVDLNQEEGKDE